MVSPALLAPGRSGGRVHPCGSRALQRGRGGGVLHHIPFVLLVPHHGQCAGTPTRSSEGDINLHQLLHTLTHTHTYNYLECIDSTEAIEESYSFESYYC